MKELMCLLGIHDWKKYWKDVSIKSNHDEKTIELLHRECEVCGKKQIRTQLPTQFGGRDTNRWIEV